MLWTVWVIFTIQCYGQFGFGLLPIHKIWFRAAAENSFRYVYVVLWVYELYPPMTRWMLSLQREAQQLRQEIGQLKKRLDDRQRESRTLDGNQLDCDLSMKGRCDATLSYWCDAVVPMILRTPLDVCYSIMSRVKCTIVCHGVSNFHQFYVYASPPPSPPFPLLLPYHRLVLFLFWSFCGGHLIVDWLGEEPCMRLRPRALDTCLTLWRNYFTIFLKGGVACNVIVGIPFLIAGALIGQLGSQ